MIGDNVSDILLNKMNNELNTLLDSPLARVTYSLPSIQRL